MRQRVPPHPEPRWQRLQLRDLRLALGRRPIRHNVTSIQTSINGAAQFNNRMVTIEVDLPRNYGSVGLNPPGDVDQRGGLVEDRVQRRGGNDTTTWGVSIRGNPVHLVLP